MATIGEAAFSQGDILRRLRQLERAIAQVAAGRRLESASVGAGGLRLFAGGSLTLEDGGDVVVLDGGSVRLIGGGSLETIVGGIPGEVHGGVIPDTFFVGPVVQPSIALFPSYVAGTTGATFLELDGETLENPVGFLWAESSGQLVLTAGADLLGYAGGIAQILAEGAVVIEAGVGQQGVIKAGNELFLQSDIDTVLVDHTETAAGANCVITVGGQIQRSTSSLRYKTNVGNADVDVGAVLGLQPITFQERREAEADPDGAPRHLGLAAEEVADAGLEELVVRDSDDRPDAVDYAHLTVALLAVVQHQQTQISELAARVEALDGRRQAVPTPQPRPPASERSRRQSVRNPPRPSAERIPRPRTRTWRRVQHAEDEQIEE